MNERLRTKALHLSQQLTTALQKPADAALELGLLVRYLPGDHVVTVLTVVQPTISICVRIGVQLGVFTILAESNTPKTAQQLSDETKAEKLLIGELHFLSSLHNQ